MKKSKIIIPALALIALSTVASVTGTVAWFTATRQVTVTAGEFAITKTSSNLSVVLGDGAYTEATDNVIEVDEDAILTHGSFNHTNSTFFVPDATATSVTGVSINDEDLTTKLVQSTTEDNKNIVTAVTWTMALSIKFADAGRDMALFFNAPASTVKLADDATKNPEETGKAFRIAFVANGVTKSGVDSTSSQVVTKVWAPHQAFNKSKYVANTNNMNGTAYSSGTLIYENNGASVPNDESADLSTCQSNLLYLGYYEFAANATITLNFNVVAWFEGTDENITEESTVMESVIASMKFDAKTIGDTQDTQNP